MTEFGSFSGSHSQGGPREESQTRRNPNYLPSHTHAVSFKVWKSYSLMNFKLRIESLRIWLPSRLYCVWAEKSMIWDFWNISYAHRVPISMTESHKNSFQYAETVHCPLANHKLVIIARSFASHCELTVVNLTLLSF